MQLINYDACMFHLGTNFIKKDAPELISTTPCFILPLLTDLIMLCVRFSSDMIGTVYHKLIIWGQLRVAHATGIPGKFSSTSKETANQRPRHAPWHVRHARVVMHVGIANARWRGKLSRHSRRMRNPQFYVSYKKPIAGMFILRWAQYFLPLIGDS